MLTFRKQTYRELNHAGSPAGNLAIDQSRVTRTLLVQGNDLTGMARDFLGYAQAVNGGISRKVPMPFLGLRDFSGLPTLWATQFSFKGFPSGKKPRKMIDDATRIASYNETQIELTYETCLWDVFPDQADGDDPMLKGIPGTTIGEDNLKRYIVKEFQPAGQMITLPKGCMLFVGETTICDGIAGKQTTQFNMSPPKYIPFWNVRYTWKFVPFAAVPCKVFNPTSAGAIDSALGCINNLPFPVAANPNDPTGGIYPPGTLLLVGAAITPHTNPFAGRVYDVQYSFQYVNNKGLRNVGNGDIPVAAGHNWVPYLRRGKGAPGAPDFVRPEFSFVKVSTDGTYRSDATEDVHIYQPADFSTLFKPG